MLPDLFVPSCDPNDGLYDEVQLGGYPGSRWCVNRYTGEQIAGTSTPYDGTPVCPGTCQSNMTVFDFFYLLFMFFVVVVVFPDVLLLLCKYIYICCFLIFFMCCSCCCCC